LPHTTGRRRASANTHATSRGATASGGNRQGGSRSGSGPRNNGGGRPATGASALDLALDAAQSIPQPENVTFRDLGLPEPMVLALARRGIAAPFAIQTRALPDALAGRDVLGRAQTGSGKTLAFGLPMLTRLMATRGARRPGAPRGLVLVPTRELARQVADTLVALGHTVDLSVTMVYGGAPIGRQIDRLKAGVDVVVATPGRLLDLIERRALSLSLVEVTVLDEADHMADLGFMPDVKRILDQTPAGGQRLLFSATLDRGVERLVRDYLNDPAIHAVASATSSVEGMDHLVFTVSADDKLAVTAEIAARPARTLIFVATKHGADRLVRRLATAGVEAAAIHGNLNQNQRTRALAAFTDGSPRVLVATDVAARGIHVDDVDLVVHFDPPKDDKHYLHRSGRTARAGTRGTVLSLIEHSQERELGRLHRGAGIEATAHRVRPGHEAVVEIATSGAPIPVRPPRPVRAVDPERTGGRPGGPGGNRGARGGGRGAGRPGMRGAPGTNPAGNRGRRRDAAPAA
jgi:superfamily II DNA/RNA helicase